MVEGDRPKPKCIPNFKENDSPIHTILTKETRQKVIDIFVHLITFTQLFTYLISQETGLYPLEILNY